MAIPAHLRRSYTNPFSEIQKSAEKQGRGYQNLLSAIEKSFYRPQAKKENQTFQRGYSGTIELKKEAFGQKGQSKETRLLN